jgi:hypothetical protein
MSRGHPRSKFMLKMPHTPSIVVALIRDKSNIIFYYALKESNKASFWKQEKGDLFSRAQFSGQSADFLKRNYRHG